MIKINLTLIFVFLSLQQLFAQQNESVLHDYMPYVDTALQTVNMDRSDFTMPYDIAGEDAHRLPLINKLFENPLQTMDVVYDEAEFLKDNYGKPERLFAHISDRLDAEYDHIQLPKVQEIGISRWQKFQLNRKFPEHAEAVLQFAEKALVAEKLIDSAFADLSDEETEKLRNRLPGFYSTIRNSGNTEQRSRSLRDRREAQRERRKEAQELFEITEKFRLPYLLLATKIAYEESLNLKRVIQEKGLPADESYVINSAAGKIAIGEIPEQTPLLLLLGDENHEITFSDMRELKKISVIISSGGDNVYRGDHQALGSGYFGVGILIDIKGNDTYLSRSFSQGSGFFGSGILLDLEGDDYYSTSITSQGSGAFGAGLLFDRGGNDVFKGGQYVQGSGWVKGYGAVLSGRGGDRFITSSEFIDVIRYEDRHLSLAQGMGMGYRPYASGGIGMLVNEGGNNLYQTDIYGQGSAYWYSLGGIVDFGGHDQYISHQYAQGSGVHMAFGALIDDGGNDLFKTHGVSQGCGHDYAFGGFLSKGGDDDVICAGLSQGAGNANGSGLFINGGGNNSYIAKQANTQGYSDFRRGFGMTGIFLNFSNEAWYGAYHGEPLSRWTSGTYGSGLDIAEKQEEKPEEDDENDEERQRIAANIADNVEDLFLQASESLIQMQFLVNPARDSLAAKGEDAVKHLMNFLDTDLPRENHAIRTLIRMFDEKPTPYLRDSLESDNSSVAGGALNFLVEMAKDSLGRGAMDNVLKFREHDRWQRRVNAYRYIGYYGDPELMEYVQQGLEESHYHIRRAASEAMRRSAHIDFAEVMEPLLSDTSQQVRYNTERFFAELKEDGVVYLLENVVFDDQKSDMARLHALGAMTRLNEINTDKALQLLELTEKDWRYRKRLAEIAAISGHEAKEEFRKAFENEKDPFVKRVLQEKWRE